MTLTGGMWYCMVCDIFGRDWSPSANGRRIYQIVCYKMIPNYYPYSINFIFSTYYPINIQNTHILEVCDWQKKPLQGHPASWKKP